MTANIYHSFIDHVGEIQDLNTAQGLLGWDLEVMMPPQGSEIRAKQMSTLAKLSHQLSTAPQFIEQLNTLRTPEHWNQLSPLQQAVVREVGIEVDRAQKLPVSLVQEMTETSAQAQPLWVEARKTNDFGKFAPILEKTLALSIQMAEALGYEGSPYNALMDLYEPGLTVEIVDPIFQQLRKDLVPLVKAIQESPVKPQTEFLHRPSDIEKQRQFSELVIKAMGFNLEAGRLDKTAHPFCMGMGPGDVRLTTRYFEDDLISSLFSAMHEAGHGLYEQGVNPELTRTPLAGGASLGIHESQSRMWENLVGRSRAFWTHFFPILKEHFPTQLQDIDLDIFYQAINRSAPSFIRVESDEVTYNLHIMLRYEIERELIEGRLAVKDIPAMWNEKMQDYLGITPANDSEGCLQDVHWAHGSFGYFPTYTLGNLYSAQFFNQAQKANPALLNEISSGNLKPLQQWLQKEIHWHSKTETPKAIVQRVTGEGLNPQYFTSYLWAKYAPIYGLSAPYSAVS